MPTYYVFDGQKMIVEGMTKEQIINAIAEATGNTPQNVDEGFITTIKETNNNRSLHIWKGTQAQYEALPTHDADTFYIISDDTAVQDLQTDVEDLQTELQDVAEDVANLKETVYQIDDTGWLDWEQTPLSAGTTHKIGKYRVKNGIAYFDLQNYNVGLYQNVDDIINIPLPVELDVSGKSGIPFVYQTNNSSETYKSAQGALSTTNHETTLTIECVGTGELMYYVWGSFCYPIADEE